MGASEAGHLLDEIQHDPRRRQCQRRTRQRIHPDRQLTARARCRFFLPEPGIMVAQQLDHYEGSPHVLKQWDTG